MIPISKKIRIITRSRYSARIYHGKKNGVMRFSLRRLCSVSCPKCIGFGQRNSFVEGYLFSVKGAVSLLSLGQRPGFEYKLSKR